MRLTKEQMRDILKVTEGFLDENSSLYLIGSRVKDHLKGGDIDLLILCKPSLVSELKKQKALIVNSIMKQKTIDDTQVDLTICSEKQLKEDPFLSSLQKNKVLLS